MRRFTASLDTFKSNEKTTHHSMLLRLDGIGTSPENEKFQGFADTVEHAEFRYILRRRQIIGHGAVGKIEGQRADLLPSLDGRGTGSFHCTDISIRRRSVRDRTR